MRLIRCMWPGLSGSTHSLKPVDSSSCFSRNLGAGSLKREGRREGGGEFLSVESLCGIVCSQVGAQSQDLARRFLRETRASGHYKSFLFWTPGPAWRQTGSKLGRGRAKDRRVWVCCGGVRRRHVARLRLQVPQRTPPPRPPAGRLPRSAERAFKVLNAIDIVFWVKKTQLWKMHKCSERKVG